MTGGRGRVRRCTSLPARCTPSSSIGRSTSQCSPPPSVPNFPNYSVGTAMSSTGASSQISDEMIEIKLVDDYLSPYHQVLSKMTEIFSKHIDHGATTWNRVSQETKQLYGDEFQKSFRWDPDLDDQASRESIAAGCYRDMIDGWKDIWFSKALRPECLDDANWNVFLNFWSCMDESAGLGGDHAKEFSQDRVKARKVQLSTQAEKVSKGGAFATVQSTVKLDGLYLDEEIERRIQVQVAVQIQKHCLFWEKKMSLKELTHELEMGKLESKIMKLESEVEKLKFEMETQKLDKRLQAMYHHILHHMAEKMGLPPPPPLIPPPPPSPKKRRQPSGSGVDPVRVSPEKS